MAPSDWLTDGDRLKHAESDISFQACLDVITPVERDGDGGVVGNGRCIVVHHDPEGGGAHPSLGIFHVIVRST